ncbi:adenine phosphoribosyltransferase [Leifsonia shinshuensis]|uniref:adenine phosphoribosyltransferase n=1 Tax=Leifsonia shinshuensis TaxID=150026 RepID=UPI001F50ACFC|nr:adenine phosphoribosyltransferase [Leifsonia shinshuensis]
MDDIRSRLRSTFQWIGDRTDAGFRADVTGWWRDATILGEIGAGLAALFGDADPTVVMGTQSRGSILGVLTALHLGVGFAEVRKEPSPSADSDAWWTTATAPDYRDRHLDLGLRRSRLRSGDRVLFVDDWIDTGAQASACRRLVDLSGASWLGGAVVVDGLGEPALRRRLTIRSLLHIRDL